MSCAFQTATMRPASAATAPSRLRRWPTVTPIRDSSSGRVIGIADSRRSTPRSASSSPAARRLERLAQPQHGVLAEVDVVGVSATPLLLMLEHLPLTTMTPRPARSAQRRGRRRP